MNSRVFHWKNQQKNIGIFPGGMDDSEYPPANARCNLADSDGPLVTWSRPCVGRWTFFSAPRCLVVNTFAARPFPLRLYATCTWSALGRFEVGFWSHRHRSSLRPSCWLVQRQHPSQKLPQQHPSAGFIPTAWKEAKMATAASTWGLLADVSCKPRHSGHSEHSAFHYDVLVAFVDRSPGGKYSLNLTLSVGSATRVQTLREGVYWKGGVKNWIEIVVFFCM